MVSEDSTTAAAVRKLLEDVRQTLEPPQYVYAVSVDFRAATPRSKILRLLTEIKVLKNLLGLFLRVLQENRDTFDDGKCSGLGNPHLPILIRLPSLREP